MADSQVEDIRSTLAVFQAILRLKRLPRTGWLLAGVPVAESIADHSYGTAMVACFLAELVNADISVSELDAPLDTGRVAQIALVHDLAESLITDLPRQTAELLGSDIKHEAEGRAVQRILSDAPGADKYLELWREYETGQTPEGRLVRDADKLEMALQAGQYAVSGNANLAEFWQGHTWNFTVSERVFQTLKGQTDKR